MSVGDRRSLRPSAGARPMGPRTRQPRSSTVPDLVTNENYNPQRLSQASVASRTSTLSSPALSPVSSDPGRALYGISETRPSTPASSPRQQSYSPSPSPVPSLSVKPVQKVQALTAPAVKFEPPSISFKGLPLEAALWTFDSQELQTLVSRAIRSSAKESFIRLLSKENLDTSIPAEIERLKTLKANQQSRYRFNIQRRTMLLQALLSFSATDGAKEQDAGALVTRLATQLSEITAACDSLAEELVSITDQLAQLTKLLDVHWASALAIALRKLNASYGKRTTELNTTRERVIQLEVQLEDAWKEAEKIAQEIDELDAVIESDDEEDADEDEEDVTGDPFDEGTAVIDRAEVVSISSHGSGAPVNRARVSSGTILKIQPVSPVAFAPLSLMPDAQASASEAEQEEEQKNVEERIQGDNPPPLPPKDVDNTDKISVRSRRSVRSHRSTRSIDTNRVSVVSAARIRSQRASIASLRLPRNLRQFDYPPVPDLPRYLSSLPPSSYHRPSLPSSKRNSLHSSAPLNPETRGRQRTSIDDLQFIMRHVAVDGSFLSRPQSTVDDLYVMPPRAPLADEIEEIPRSPAKFRRSVDDISMIANSSRIAGHAVTNDTIPSIWMNADAPKTPAERVESLMQDRINSKPSSYLNFRLKTFTKRYSVTMPRPFPRLKAMSPMNRNHR